MLERKGYTGYRGPDGGREGGREDKIEEYR